MQLVEPLSRVLCLSGTTTHKKLEPPESSSKNSSRASGQGNDSNSWVISNNDLQRWL